MRSRLGMLAFLMLGLCASKANGQGFVYGSSRTASSISYGSVSSLSPYPYGSFGYYGRNSRYSPGFGATGSVTRYSPFHGYAVDRPNGLPWRQSPREQRRGIVSPPTSPLVPQSSSEPSIQSVTALERPVTAYRTPPLSRDHGTSRVTRRSFATRRVNQPAPRPPAAPVGGLPPESAPASTINAGAVTEQPVSSTGQGSAKSGAVIGGKPLTTPPPAIPPAPPVMKPPTLR